MWAYFPNKKKQKNFCTIFYQKLMLPHVVCSNTQEVGESRAGRRNCGCQITWFASGSSTTQMLTWQVTRSRFWPVWGLLDNSVLSPVVSTWHSTFTNRVIQTAQVRLRQNVICNGDNKAPMENHPLSYIHNRAGGSIRLNSRSREMSELSPSM